MSKEAGVLPIRITVDGADGRDVRVELAPHLFTGVRVHHEVEGLLDRPTGISGVFVDVPTGVFGEAGVRLSGRRSGNEYQRPNVQACQSKTYDHSRQIVRAVVVWSCPLSFEGLLAVDIDLALIDSIKVFPKGIQSSSIVANQDLESGDLVEVERAVVAEPKQGQLKTRP